MHAPATDRARAARILVAVLHQGKTTDQSFGQVSGAGNDKSPSPLCQELVYGSLRYFYSLNRALEGLLAKELRSKDLDLRCLMIVGAYQLAYMRIPDHAAINETVNACRSLRKPWARSLVNAVLRGFSKQLDGYRAERSFELPEWISQRLVADYADDADSIMAGLLERAPMSLRINSRRTTGAAYAAKLDAADIPWLPGIYPEHLVLETPVRTGELPGYGEGEVCVQDGGALVAAHLLPVPPQGRVLDACAAPGGKLFHLAEAHPDADLVGIELSQPRFEHLNEERARLGHDHVTLLQADASSLDWWDEQPFAAILLDAPCSGIGSLRRHPDIKHLRAEQDLIGYQQLQLALLRNLWRVLASAGNLLYCTCSLFQEENDNVVQQFLAQTEDAMHQPITAPLGQSTGYGWQLLPQPGVPEDVAARPNPCHQIDGFYYSLLSKKPA